MRIVSIAKRRLGLQIKGQVLDMLLSQDDDERDEAWAVLSWLAKNTSQ